MTAAFSALSGGWLAPAPLAEVPFVSAVMSVDSMRGVRAVISGHGVTARGPTAEQSLGLSDDLGDPERLAADPVVADGIDEELRPDEHQKLPEVDLRDEHLTVVAEDRFRIGRERVEVTQMRVGDGRSLAVETFDGGSDRAIGRSPAEDQQLALLRAEDLERRDVVGDAGDLRRTERLHPVVVIRVVADVACDVGLLEAADTVLEARCPGDGPRTGQCLGIALVWPEGGRVARVLDADRRQVGKRRDPPRLRAGR